MTAAEFHAYHRSSLDFIAAEFRGPPEKVRAAAGAVQVFRNGRVVTVRDLHGELVSELTEAEEAWRCYDLAAELDLTAARALLTYSGYLGVQVDELDSAAAEACTFARDAIYGSPWD